MEILKSILDALNGISPEAWTLIIETVIGAVAVSPLVMWAKKIWKIHSDKIMLAVTIFASLGAGVFAYLHNDPQFAQWFALVQGWLIFATSQPLYRYAFKPFAKKMAKEIDKARIHNEEIMSAIVPPTGLPLVETPAKTPTQIQEFTL